MSLLLLLYVPVNLFAQNEATLGRWYQMYYLDASQTSQVVKTVVWRYGPADPEEWTNQDQNRGGYAPPGAWRRVYGIHAALLPITGATPANGWVMLWGYGSHNHDQPRIPRENAEPFYFGSIFFDPSDPRQNYSLDQIAYTPVLLWYPVELPFDVFYSREVAYGYVRYLFDTDMWQSPSPSWPVYDLFCSGHAFLPDGRLFVAGGHTDLLRDGSSYVAGLRLFTMFESSRFTRSGVDVSLGIPNAQNGLWRVYQPARRDTDEPPEPRWYPSVVALPDGKMLIVGGIRYAAGAGRSELRDGRTWWHEFFDPCTGQYTRGAPIGEVVIQHEGQEVRLGFSVLDGTDLSNLYPRLHLISLWDGQRVQARVVSTGPSWVSYALNDTPSWQEARWWELTTARRSVGRTHGTSVLLPNFKAENPRSWEEQMLYEVMVLGGGYVPRPNDDRYADAHASTEILSFSPLTEPPFTEMQVTEGPSLRFPRAHLNAVLLPTGQILVIGGISGTFAPDGSQARHWLYPDQLVLETELLTHTPTGWRVEPVATAPAELADEADAQFNNPEDKTPNGARVYHSTALLLPDGRVLAAGSSTSAWRRERDSSYVQRPFENYVPTIYSPPYLFKPDGSPRGETDRPRIVWINPDPTELNYGQVFKVTYALSSEGAAIRSVALVRPGSVTHSFDFEQRLVRLHFVVASSNVLHITAPWDPAIAPPGWYMLFLVDENGVPSVARWVRLKRDCFAQPATLTVVLEGVQGASEEQAEAIAHTPLTLELRHAGTGAPLMTYTLPMGRPDEQGRVALRLWSDLPAGQYELYVHPYRSWLGRRVRLNWQSGGSYTLLLRNGDVVKDNAVDIVDFVAVLEQLGTLGVSEADVNCDGVVDEADVALVATNTGTQGDE